MQKKFTMVRPMKKYLTAFGLINAFALVNSVFFLKRERERERETLTYLLKCTGARAYNKIRKPTKIFPLFFYEIHRFFEIQRNGGSDIRCLLNFYIFQQSFLVT